MIFVAGAQLQIPTATLEGQILSSLVVIGGFVRCVGIAGYVRSLRERVQQKTEALHAALAQVQMLANKDELTGLSNRRAIVRWLGEQMAFCDRNNLPLCVAILDIDHFKRINDTFGHAAGDSVLQTFAQRASQVMRSTDRLGGTAEKNFWWCFLRQRRSRLKRPCKGCSWK